MANIRTPVETLMSQLSGMLLILQFKIQTKYPNLDDNESIKLSAKTVNLIKAFALNNNTAGTLNNIGQIDLILNFIFNSATVLKNSKKFNLTDREFLEISIDTFSPELIKKLIELN